jgi:hypothetical protein
VVVVVVVVVVVGALRLRRQHDRPERQRERGRRSGCVCGLREEAGQDRNGAFLWCVYGWWG